MAALRYGPASARCVVLLPGFTCNACDWPRAMLGELVRGGFQVEAIDWPDSGGSDRLAVASYAIPDLARAAAEYARAELPGREIHWVGLSMGSLVAQEIARQGGPADSYALLLTSSGSWSHGFARLTTLARLLGVRVDTSVDEVAYALSALREELAVRPCERDLAELRRRVRASVERAWPYGRGPWRQLMAVSDHFAGGGAQLKSLGAPTLIVHGARDPLLPVEGARALAAQLGGNARYLELPELGHELVASRLEPVMAALSEHLKAASRGIARRQAPTA
jgi:pimeloyl-ACP methyl ester carboxylesterase